MAIVGATATGKTAVAVEIASEVAGAELVSIDSMAVYREMDVGTEKPATTENWHLVDIADPGADYSVALFQHAALEAVAAIHGRGHRALFVGGTGLYHRAVLDGLELPGLFPSISSVLEDEAATPGGLPELYARLSELDPLAASRIEPGNSRRIVRALEVCLGSGRPYSSFGPGLETYGSPRARLAGLAMDRAEIDRRLEERLDTELAAGWVDEVARLAKRPAGLSKTARQAIGYKELLAHVAGEMSLADARTSTLRRLKSFARRQEAWFRRDPRVVWFDATAPDVAEVIVDWWNEPMADRRWGWETGQR